MGIHEAVDEDYLHYRITSTRYRGEHLREAVVPLLWRPGGHAVHLDAASFAPHLTPTEYPGVAITVDLYRAGGVRGVEIGSLMLGWTDRETGEEMPAARELVRLAIPRRVYTQSHIDYVIEGVIHVCGHRDELSAYRIVEQAPFLRHFSARLEPGASR